MATGLFVLAILIAKLFPATPIGRWLHLHLVLLPLRLLSRIETKHLVFALIGLFAWQAFAVAAPLDLALIAAWDLAVYVDAVACLSAAALIARGKAALGVLKARLARLPDLLLKPLRVAGKRERRTRARKMSFADNDDEPAPAFKAA